MDAQFPATAPESSSATQMIPHSREVASFLRAEDFYIHRHGWIWEAFARLHERRVPIDLLTVSEELDQLGRLAEVGGPAYLTQLINNVPTSLHAEAYGRIVEANAIRRRMLNAANEIAKLGYQQEASIDTVMDVA